MTNFNNDVYNSRGKVIGFRCTECGKIYHSGWGDICNQCRSKNEKHNELIKVIKKLTKEISNLKEIK